jgi:hypothetical protein
MLMQTIQQVSQKTLKFESIFTDAPLNQYFSYKELQERTGFEMSDRNKTYMRSALRRLKLPYEVRRGDGIVLVGEKNAIRIAAYKVIRIDNAVRSGEKTTKQISIKTYHLLTEPERKNINFLSALFGSIRSYSNNAKKIFNHQPLIIGERI